MHVHRLTVETRPMPRRAAHLAGDLLIDGTPLLEQIERATRRELDIASPLGWTKAEYAHGYAARLTGSGPPSLESGRCELLVCPLCGDLGCGCVSCVVSVEGEFVTWTELGWEADYDPAGVVLYPMGGFRFRVAEVAGALSRHLPPT